MAAVDPWAPGPDQATGSRQPATGNRESPHPGRFQLLAAIGLLVALVPPTAWAGAPDPAFLRDVAEHRRAAEDYRAAVEALLERAYRQERQHVERRFDQKATAEERAARERRGAAIKRFEDFLRRFPDDPRWTPDAMFRLAELHFERAEDEHQAAWERYNDAARSTSGQLPQPPVKDYGKSIELFTRLHERFPDYRLMDGALYLLGYCIDETGNRREAKRVFLSLVCDNRPGTTGADAEARLPRGVDPYAGCTTRHEGSPLLADAWMRIGEIDFDEARFEPAIHAYRRVAAFQSSRLHELALYKIAWSHYKVDRFAEAVVAFDRVLTWGTAQKQSGKGQSHLQRESLQYIGISLTEPDWNGDGVDDPDAGLARAARLYAGRDREPHVRDVYAAMGDVYFQASRYEQAVAVFQEVLRRWPDAPDAPGIQDRIITCYERLRDFDRALAERDVLVRTYGPGSAWGKSNQRSPQALAQARQLAEVNLERAATFHHRTAQLLRRQLGTAKDPRLAELARKEYTAAADLYRQYLTTFPASAHRYEFTFNLAEALFFSERYADAAQLYEQVRDWRGEVRLREEAALGVLKSREELVRVDVARGALVDPPMPQAGAAIQARKPAEPWLRLQQAEDYYVEKIGGPRSAQLAYAAALISFKHHDLAGARQRLAKVVEKFCKTQEGGLAADALIESFKIEGDLAALAREATRLKDLSCGTEATRQARQGELVALINDVRFKTAEKLQADANCEAAGPLYLKLADEAPRDQNADKALNNAAVCFETVHRYGEARRTYERIVREYPGSPLVEEALYRAALNHERFFEFEEAISNYLQLAEDRRFEKSRYRVTALGLAAQLLLHDQQYARAAALFRRFSAASGAAEDAETGFWNACLALEKAKKPDEAAAALREFIRRFGDGKTPTASGRVIAAYFKLAELAEGLKDAAHAEKLLRRAVSEFQSRRLPPSGDAAEFAARASFRLAELQYERFLGVPLFTKTSKLLERSVQEQLRLVNRLREQYDAILSFGRARWSLAALFRQAELYYQFAQKLIKAPVPAELTRRLGPEAEEIYREQLEQLLRPLEKEAQERWAKVITKGVEFGLANEWTRRSLERLNAFRPDEFPLVKSARIALELDRVSP